MAAIVRWAAWQRIWKASREKSKPKPTGFLANVDDYGRQVCLYFNGPEHREFKSLTKELARNLGTRNQSDTVLASLRKLARS